MIKSRLFTSLSFTKGLIVLGLIAGAFSPISAQSYKKIVKCPGGQGYSEDANGKTIPGISIQEDRGPDQKLKLTAVSNNWSNENATLAWYFYTTEGEFDVDLVTKIKVGVTLDFDFVIEDVNSYGLEAAPASITLVGKGVSDTTALLRFKASKTGYYKYKLIPKSDPQRAIEVQSLQFKSLDNAAADVHPANYLSSPSVHLSDWRSTGLVTAGSKYDWCYQEILVPEGEDPLYTYYMSLGVLSGYFGIQTNSPTERRVLFSMWDKGSTEEDPNLPDYLKAGFVDHAEYTTVNRFGGEGTGMQSFVNGWNWEIGVPVKFLVNSRLEEFNDTLKSSTGVDSIVLRKNTLVSAWFHSNPAKGWQYVSTLRMPNQVKYFDSWYSFLENFGFSNGQEHRKAFYYNAFAKEQSNDPLKPGPWRHFNKVNFGNTDGVNGQRIDFEQGAAADMSGAFYMSSGGYGVTKKTADLVALKLDKSVVEDLDLTPFINRVDQAIVKEKAKNDSIKMIQRSMLPKNGWSIMTFSSEEVSGEGPINGRAACVIDGDNNTYWHSKWSGAGASFPHSISFKMDDVHTVTGIQFRLSGGSSRRMKTIDIQTSETGRAIDFKTLGEFTCPDQDQFYFKFDAPIQAKSIKVIIKDAQTSAVFCRINEIDVSSSDQLVSTPIVKEPKSGIVPNPAKDQISITPSKAANTMTVEVIDLGGRTLQTQSYHSVGVGSPISHSLSGVSDGIYSVRLSLDKQPEMHRLIVKK